ncbi:hypothetical protein K8I31_10150, partial [bacterium]|nr:hypothetical protein [bacterium]
MYSTNESPYPFMPMTPAITIQNVPSHYHEALFKALLDANRIHCKRVMLENSDNGADLVAHLWLKNDKFQSNAIQMLNECEVEDRTLVASEATEEAFLKLKEKTEQSKQSKRPEQTEPETIIAPGPSHDGEHEA